MATTPVAVAGAATLSAHVHPHRLIFRPPFPSTGLPPPPPPPATSAYLPTAARVEKVGSFASRTSTWPSRSWTEGWSLMRRQPCIKASLADLDAALVVKNKAVDIAQDLKGTSIFLIGMQCAMKTILGKVLADALRYCYFDSDSLVIQAAGGESAAKSYTRRDEGLQNAETEVLKQLSAMGRLVVCTGDGAVTSTKNLAFLRHGISLWVDVPLNIIAKDAMEFPGQHRFSCEISASDTSSKVLNKLDEIYQGQRDGHATADAIISVQKVAAHLSVPSLSKGGPASCLHLQQTFGVPMRQPASSVPKRGSAGGARAKKPKSGRTMSGLLKYPSTGPSGLGNMANRGPTSTDMNEAGTFDPLIGRKVFTRWPEDNNFYEAIITDYDAAKGLHVLHYDMNTPNESWELVNLKEISPDDIRWDGEDPGISCPAGRAGVGGRGARRPTGRSTIQGAGRGRGAPKPQSRKDGPASENGNGKRNRDDDIEILHTDTLIKEVERVVNSNNPDPFEIDKAKRALKEHEQSLVDAIARLTDASDGESVGAEYEDGTTADPPGAQVLGLKDDAVAGDALEQHHQIRESVPAEHQRREEIAAL